MSKSNLKESLRLSSLSCDEIITFSNDFKLEIKRLKACTKSCQLAYDEKNSTLVAELIQWLGQSLASLQYPGSFEEEPDHDVNNSDNSNSRRLYDIRCAYLQDSRNDDLYFFAVLCRLLRENILSVEESVLLIKRYRQRVLDIEFSTLDIESLVSVGTVLGGIFGFIGSTVAFVMYTEHLSFVAMLIVAAFAPLPAIVVCICIFSGLVYAGLYFGHPLMQQVFYGSKLGITKQEKSDLQNMSWQAISVGEDTNLSAAHVGQDETNDESFKSEVASSSKALAAMGSGLFSGSAMVANEDPSAGEESSLLVSLQR